MNFLETQNANGGFYQTILWHEWNPDAAWRIASKEIYNALKGSSTDSDLLPGIQLFLDSKMGRLFAHDAVGFARETSMASPNRRADGIRQAIKMWRRRGITDDMQETHGIPVGLRLLDGWIYHFVIDAEINS